MTSDKNKSYKNILKELNQKYYLLLSEYTRTYPNYKLYSSTIPSFKKSLEDDKNNLVTVQNDFFLLKNALEKENKTISSKITTLNGIITTIEKENKTLKSSLKGLKEASESAMGMFDDTQRQYNEYLLGNIYLFGGVIGAGVIMYKSLNM